MIEKGIFIDVTSGKAFVSEEDLQRFLGLEAAAKVAAENEARLKESISIFIVVFALWNVFKASSKPKRQSPPWLGEALILLFSQKEVADAVLGDLQEQFKGDCNSVGVRRAKLRYWLRAVRSAGPLLITRLRNWGLVAVLIEYGRRKIG